MNYVFNMRRHDDQRFGGSGNVAALAIILSVAFLTSPAWSYDQEALDQEIAQQRVFALTEIVGRSGTDEEQRALSTCQSRFVNAREGQPDWNRIELCYVALIIPDIRSLLMLLTERDVSGTIYSCVGAWSFENQDAYLQCYSQRLRMLWHMKQLANENMYTPETLATRSICASLMQEEREATPPAEIWSSVDHHCQSNIFRQGNRPAACRIMQSDAAIDVCLMIGEEEIQPRILSAVGNCEVLLGIVASAHAGHDWVALDACIKAVLSGYGDDTVPLIDIFQFPGHPGLSAD